jgi:hypothetical protein
MIRVNACNMHLVPFLVFRAIAEIQKTGGKPVKAIVSRAQDVAWMNVATMVNGFEFDPKEFPDLTQRVTMGGIPLELREGMSNSRVIFVDTDNRELGTIENLAIPVGF